MWFVSSQLAFITVILAIIAYGVYQGTPAAKALAAKRQLEAEQKAEEEKLKILKQQEVQKTLKNNAKIEIKNLQTNSSYVVINEFFKVNARLSVGVNYMDLPSVIASAKLATQQFEKSKDYNVCPYLSELIKKNMFYYELSFECFQRKFYNRILNNDLEQIIINLFPELKSKTIFNNFDTIVQTIWMEASQCSDEIQAIIEDNQNNGEEAK
ncbi:hypothetical protein [Nostoc sp. ChiSLP03a]|uniref:hypothetical protein n=1 Tax=Nostoc sp. ChiSLP03a TaxID=3075380 RepID=UPI002AD399A8|nr:hypothetical protein [Nostoc sp. ChiSLP03a]MDZ8210418.1 hypothetical protein [Nostoc sp. ChiSLP03a]